jgi:hypothetical protein
VGLARHYPPFTLTAALQGRQTNSHEVIISAISLLQVGCSVGRIAQKTLCRRLEAIMSEISPITRTRGAQMLNWQTGLFRSSLIYRIRMSWRGSQGVTIPRPDRYQPNVEPFALDSHSQLSLHYHKYPSPLLSAPPWQGALNVSESQIQPSSKKASAQEALTIRRNPLQTACPPNGISCAALRHLRTHERSAGC